MGKLADVVGGDLISPSLIVIFTSLTQDAQWRVRMAVYELLGDLSISFGREIFMKSLEPLFISFLKNNAASVRDMGIDKTAELAQAFGSDWVITSFIPKAVDSFNED